MIEVAARYDKPVRIGVNWGSLDQELLDAADGRERAAAPSRWTPQQVMREALVRSALESARSAPRSSACARDRIILSCKVSRRAGPDRGLPRARARAATIRCTSA